MDQLEGVAVQLATASEAQRRLHPQTTSVPLDVLSAGSGFGSCIDMVAGMSDVAVASGALMDTGKLSQET